MGILCTYSPGKIRRLTIAGNTFIIAGCQSFFSASPGIVYYRFDPLLKPLSGNRLLRCQFCLIQPARCQNDSFFQGFCFSPCQFFLYNCLQYFFSICLCIYQFIFSDSHFSLPFQFFPSVCLFRLSLQFFYSTFLFSILQSLPGILSKNVQPFQHNIAVYFKLLFHKRFQIYLYWL